MTMEEENNVLVKVLNELARMTKLIVHKAIKILDETNGGCQVYETVLQRLPTELTKSETIRGLVEDHVKKVISQITEDARAIDKEIDTFYKEVTPISEGPFKQCTFLSEVWMGDMYELRKIKALKRLVIDMEHQCSKLNVISIATKVARIIIDSQET